MSIESVANLIHPDAIAIQSAGLRITESGAYATTLYSDSDEYGMLGGNIRILAAREMYLIHPSSTFVFCNGVSAKQVAKFGPEVPIEAGIYAEEFKSIVNHNIRRGTDGALLTPKILFEDTSANTIASIREILMMCTVHKWKRIVMMSSDYHIPRVKAICDLICEKLSEPPIEISFISAEAILKETRPGIYDKEIDLAYQTPAAHQRLKNEMNGVEDIKAGKYNIGEFQLAPKN